MATAAGPDFTPGEAPPPRPPLNNGTACTRAEPKASGIDGRREAESVRQQREGFGGLLDMVGHSAPMRRAFERIQFVAPTRSTVLITGESGTGKELVARALHQLSPRKDSPFVALNFAAIPKDLAESELFGHAKGAFTGATANRIGKFVAAHGGTLLIDEIGEMDRPVQAKLLRALETRTITPVGSNEEQPVDVRVVAATHRRCSARSGSTGWRTRYGRPPPSEALRRVRAASDRVCEPAGLSRRDKGGQPSKRSYSSLTVR
jgi:transcriptional regulator of acetoin/glycerol metabolism